MYKLSGYYQQCKSLTEQELSIKEELKDIDGILSATGLSVSSSNGKGIVSAYTKTDGYYDIELCQQAADELHAEVVVAIKNYRDKIKTLLPKPELPPVSLIYSPAMAEADLLNLSGSILMGKISQKEIEEKIPNIIRCLGENRVKKELQEIQDKLVKRQGKQ